MAVLREAVSRSNQGALVTTGCPGLCAHGPIATVGPGTASAGTLRLTARAVLGPLDAEDVAVLADVLLGSGPVVLPAALHGLVLTPPATTSLSARGRG